MYGRMCRVLAVSGRKREGDMLQQLRNPLLGIKQLHVADWAWSLTMRSGEPEEAPSRD